MSPEELVTAAQRGNHDAFAQLWKLYRTDVQAFVYRRLRDRHTAEDITSEAFLRAWKYLPGFTWQGKGFRGWIITIASRLVADHYRSQHEINSRPFDFGDSDSWQQPCLDRRANPADVADQGAIAAALDAAIPTLTPGQRTSLALRFGAGMSTSDTAAAMGVSQESVKAFQHKATRKLHRHPAVRALEVAA